jgi:hypothetical protein
MKIKLEIYFEIMPNTQRELRSLLHSIKGNGSHGTRDRCTESQRECFKENGNQDLVI